LIQIRKNRKKEKKKRKRKKEETKEKEKRKKSMLPALSEPKSLNATRLPSGLIVLLGYTKQAKG